MNKVNKVLLILLVAVVAISLVLAGCCKTPLDTIVVGMSRSLTGPAECCCASPFGELYPIFFDYVNNDLGGISIGGCAFTVDSKVLNDNCDDTHLVAHTTDLTNDINGGTVHFLFGPSHPCFVEPQAPIANAQEVVLMTFEGGNSDLMQPGFLDSWPYVFMHQSFAEWFQLPVLAKTLDEAHFDCYGMHDATAYIVCDRNCYGQDYLNAAKKYFPPNITIVGGMNVTCPAAPGPIIAAMQAADPNIVCLFCCPQDVYSITAEAIAQDFNADAWVAGLGGNYGYFCSQFGCNVEGVTCFATANEKTSPAMASLFSRLESSALGFDGLDFWGHPLYWAALEIWKDAVENVGGPDPNELPDCCFIVDQFDFKGQLASYDNSSPAAKVTTVLGDTWYEMFGIGGGILDYKCHTGEIGQWQVDSSKACWYYVEIVGYDGIGMGFPTDPYGLDNYVTTGTQGFIYPKPNWRIC